MSFDGLVVRIRSSIGVSRISLPRDATFGDLKAELNRRFKVNEGTTVKLLTEDGKTEVFGQDSVPLGQLGIRHGTSLVLENVSGLDGHTSSISYKSVEKVEEKEVEEEPAEPEKNEPRFKSFDAFLQDNGYSIGDLALRQSYRPVEIKRGCMNKLPVGITIKHQKYRHVDHIEFMNVEEMKNFANYWIDMLEMAEQRAGWLYGYYVEDSHYPLGIRAVCEAIYEPPQRSFMEYSELLPDPFLNTVDRIANKLGLERIGYIFTHLPRDNVMSPKDIIEAAKRQLDTAKNIHYTGYPVSTHVTCTMCPDGEGKPVLNAFMASDSAMALLRDNMFSEEQNDIKMVQIRKASNSFEVLPQIFESGKEVSSFDSDWLIVRVNDSAPIHPMPFFKHTGFPRENREGNVDINIWKYTNTPCDFHLLLYIANTLDVDTAFAVCDSITKGEEVDGLIWDLLGGMQND